MQFDFRHISVPFRMQPGLQRMPADARHLNLLDPTGDLYREKAQMSELGSATTCMDGFDPSDALDTIHAHARASIPGYLQRRDRPLELTFEEDLAILDGRSGTVPWMCVCVPSRWAPRDKLGQRLAEIHAPVADNALLVAASDHLTRLATGGGHWERFVWGIGASPRHDQHPQRRTVVPWPQTRDPFAFAGACWLRAEHQTFLPVHDPHGMPTAQAVFTIRVMVAPLVEAVRTVADARRLSDALASMTGAVLAYKNLQGARTPLLEWLATVASSSTNPSDLHPPQSYPWKKPIT